jgi:hypothetical protein
VEDEEEVLVEAEDDSFAQTAERRDFFSFEVAWAGLDRTEQERTGKTELIQRMAEHATPEGLQIVGDIGKFRHDPPIIAFT